VPSLREWLTRKQKETRCGRAELLLADRADVWSARPENRQLPSLWQWLQIRRLTRKNDWSGPQRRMMRQATQFHVRRVLLVAVLLALVGWGASEGQSWFEARALRGRLLDANTNEVLKIVDEMAPHRRWLDPLLREAYTQAAQAGDSRQQLHVSLALLPVDAGQVDYLRRRLLEAEPHEVPVLRDALAPHQAELVDRLWEWCFAMASAGSRNTCWQRNCWPNMPGTGRRCCWTCSWTPRSGRLPRSTPGWSHTRRNRCRRSPRR
jgi:hypothetical protein